MGAGTLSIADFQISLLKSANKKNDKKDGENGGGNGPSGK